MIAESCRFVKLGELGYRAGDFRCGNRGGNVTASLATLEYREMLRMLEKRGWKKSPAQTAQEFAATIPASEITGPVAQLTQLYESARFGNHAPPAQQMSGLLRAIREILRAGTAVRS